MSCPKGQILNYNNEMGVLRRSTVKRDKAKTSIKDIWRGHKAKIYVKILDSASLSKRNLSRKELLKNGYHQQFFWNRTVMFNIPCFTNLTCNICIRVLSKRVRLINVRQHTDEIPI